MCLYLEILSLDYDATTEHAYEHCLFEKSHRRDQFKLSTNFNDLNLTEIEQNEKMPTFAQKSN